jgi:hypothetical protein
MKKLLLLASILVVFAGCNKEKQYKQDLAGTWLCYKYLLNNIDQTIQFQNGHPGYYISFTSSGTFQEYYTTTSDTLINGVLVADTVNYPLPGTYSFANNDQVLVLDQMVPAYKYVDTAYVYAPYNLERRYTIFNLTSNHVQLRNDTSQLYLAKKQ